MFSRPLKAPPCPSPSLSESLSSSRRLPVGGGGEASDGFEEDDAATGLPLCARCPLRPGAVLGTTPAANLTPAAASAGAAGAESAIGLSPPLGFAPKLNAGGREGGPAAGRACGTAGAGAGDEPRLNSLPPEGDGMGSTPTAVPGGPKTYDRAGGGTAGTAGAGKGIAVYAGGGGSGDSGCSCGADPRGCCCCCCPA